MFLDIDADVQGATELLDRIHGRLDSPGPLLRILGQDLDDYETEMFATAGRGTWAPDEPSSTSTGRTLVHTGALMARLTGSAEQSGESVEVTGTDYAGYLKRGARGMPVRDPAPEPRGSDVEKWARSLLGYITGSGSTGGLGLL